MKTIYSSPYRVYLCLLVLGLFGLFAGFNLPISLYPNSTKPVVGTGVPYGGLSAEEFLDTYGTRIEEQLKAISTNDLEVEKTEATYESGSVNYRVHFKWGADPKVALKEIKSVMNSLSSTWPSEVRDGLWVNYWAKSAGFIAISFYSEKRSLKELYELLEPVIVPRLSSVADAENPQLWNPEQEEVSIELLPFAMAELGLFPRDIQKALSAQKEGFTGGSVMVGQKRLSVQIPRELDSFKKLETMLVQTPGGKLVTLKEIARVDMRTSTSQNKIFKTSGNESLILFASPRTGGNVKNMAEEIIKIVEESMPSLPNDVQYKNLVDPSEFIRSSVENVMHEVFLAAGLAVIVLFLFVGSFKNTATAAIEIPLSMVLAFILMKLTGMNLNLISLGGLALSAGMNVDASVVVMENIFRHFESFHGKVLDFETRLKIVIRAVREVLFPLVASTIASLVVFVPLAFTSDLTNAILGDIAKAVIFSHGLSAVVALVLVPTVRLHLMGLAKDGEKMPVSPIENQIRWVENTYATALTRFIKSRYTKWISVATATLALAGLLLAVLPNLKREVIGMPDTDWVILGVNTSGNTLIRQMENETAKIENKALELFGKHIQYTFVQIQDPNSSMIMARLHDKKDMSVVWKGLEKEFVNSPLLYFWVSPWNPAELPIPDPPHMRLVIRGGELDDRTLVARELKSKLNEKDIFPNTWSEVNVDMQENIIVRPHLNKWPHLYNAGAQFLPYDLADLVRLATVGKSIGEVNLEGKYYNVSMSYPEGAVATKEDVETLPLAVAGKLIPLKAIADVNLEPAKASIYRRDGRPLFVISGKTKKGDEADKEVKLAEAKVLVEKFKSTMQKDLELKSMPSVYFEDAQEELTRALDELGGAVGLSILLIFLTLLFQFGSVVHTGIVMTAIPLGLIGVVSTLWLFGSTLSLNSVLGIILLNGIAVANSIILVDFLKKLVDEGVVPSEAAVIAARTRLRPILITSLTTILGMLPIALGMGDGGKILQPLGIAVSGGLWVSMLFTLFIVPMLEVEYYRFLEKRTVKSSSLPVTATVIENTEAPAIIARPSANEESERSLQ